MVALVINSFVCVYRAAYGWKAMVMCRDTEEPELGDFFEPHETSYFQYATPKEAFKDAVYLGQGWGLTFTPSDTYFEEARVKGTFKKMPGWYRCPNVECDHAFPSETKPTSCPQCGYED